MKYICWLDEIGMNDLPLVGGKNASLGEMIQSLAAQDVKVPGGFVVTADAYGEILKSNGIEADLKKLLKSVDKQNLQELSKIGQAARALIKKAGLPVSVQTDIRQAYKQLENRYGKQADVAVRSSATAEDLPEASFAGQQETFLNIRGEDLLLESCLNCFASLFTDRAISYREDQGFDHTSVKLAIGVQKMVRSDLASSGVIFTLDPESGFHDVVLVTSAYGLGENIVGGRVDPDEFLIFKPTLLTGHRPLLRRKLGAKQLRLVYADNSQEQTLNRETTIDEQTSYSLSEEEVLQLARWGCLIEEHYSKIYNRPTYMDIEWAKDGLDGQLYIVQARAETVHAIRNANVLETYRLEGNGEVLLQGRAIGEKIACGPVKLIPSAKDLTKFQDGDVLVTDMTDPDWEPIMKRAAAIVTNRGGRTCHAAIVSRELGVPCVVGTGNGTSKLHTGEDITVNCSEGDIGKVLGGRIAFSKNQVQLDQLPQTKTRILLNLGNPQQAFSLSCLPVDGVGLAREEFIIAQDVRVHPLALTRFEELQDKEEKALVAKLSHGYSPRGNYFVDKLAEGIGTIAAAFFPREVILRLSDFKSNEYANLIGGRQFEPFEENPMIGFRGASRYYDDRYSDGFALECLAIKKVRDGMGLNNLKIMVPFCRTVDEGKAVIAELRKNGLVQGEDGLEVYVMCELPSNVIAADLFAEIFDGFSIGSNDLTQLVLGLDRDSEIVARLFDERNQAVVRTIAHAIEQAKAAGRKIGICGQAPSDYPDFAKFLVEHGIDSISLSEDAVIHTLLLVAKVEAALSKS